MNTDKAKALATFLNAPTKEIEEVSEAYGRYTFHDQEFLVLEDEEADDAVQDMIEMRLGDDLLDKVRDVYRLTQELIDKNGRASFLADDDEENLEGDYYIYRLN